MGSKPVKAQMSAPGPAVAAPAAATPAPPTDGGPAAGWAHQPLWLRVKESVLALPIHFTSRTVIEGLRAPDLQTLNTPLGAVIEDQVVETLNSLRSVWDPQGQYPTYSFRRQPQTFPDVLLADAVGNTLFGLELKGWYLLANEEEPNFRMLVNEAACADADLLVVVPWALANVVSGTPKVFTPFLAGTKYAAKYRTHYWQHVRDTKGSRVIEFAQGVGPYPNKADHINDQAAADNGGNFGRLARTRMMDDYCGTMLKTQLAGIPARDWIVFIRKYKPSKND